MPVYQSARLRACIVAAQPRGSGPALPDIVVVALFSKAGSNCGALLLDDSTFVGDCLCCTHIADELLYYDSREP